VVGGTGSSATSTLSGLDVNLIVGTTSGFVNIVTGVDGAAAKISAGSPDTIHLHFPTLAQGGYFINGAEGVISSGNTGFFANGLPAILGENLFITYGASALPPDVVLGVNQVVDSTNQLSNLTNTDPNAGLGGPGEEEEKKLPVCTR
jgi:hypothetical protein